MNSRFGALRRLLFVTVLIAPTLSVLGQAPARAAVTITAVRGSACSYFTLVGLFGGPQTLKGCGQVTTRTVPNGVTTSGSTTVTAATGAFAKEDVDVTISGSGIPANSKIVSVTNATTVVISAAATASSSTVSLTVGRSYTDPGWAPNVNLPSGGGSRVSDDETCPPSTPCSPGAKATYGPAVIHGGIWPEDVNSATPSGPQHASTSGTIGASGSVTSSASITLDALPYPQVPCTPGFTPPPGNTGCNDPGGFGPPPVYGDSLHVECNAQAGSTTGSTTLSNTFVAHSTDAGGSPIAADTEKIPDNPPVNFTRSGVITNVGDVFTVVFNEQIVNADGSLTVNAVHMYLFGPTAVGELVRGRVTCGTTPSSLTPSDTVAPTCGTTVVEPVGPDDPTPKTPRTELIGVFDAGGLQAINNIHVVNGTVQVGNSSGLPYLQFVPGQTGPLPITSTRADEKLPMLWSFDAVDKAGNKTHCQGAVRSVADFTGNFNSDFSVYRPPNGSWWVSQGTNAFWGTPGDIPVPADYTGDGLTNYAVYRPSTGAWYVLGGTNALWGGAAGDIPVPADYNGDGKADMAIYRPSTGAWYILGSGISAFWGGAAGDIPVPADYSGDGKADIAIYRPSTGAWYILGGTNAFWGATGDIPVPGDYTGDGKTNVAVFRPSTRVWYVLGGTGAIWGNPGDVPQPGDYNGDGITDYATYNATSGRWSVAGGAAKLWGLSGDIPLPLPYAIRNG